MPEVREGIELPLGHGDFGFGVRRKLGLSLRGRHYAQAIVLPGSWKSALVPFFANIPRRTGFRRELRYGVLNDLRPLDRQRLPTTVQQFLALAEDHSPQQPPAIPQPRLRADPDRAAELVAKLSLQTARPAVALMPGAEYGPAKRWPAEQFAALADRLAEQGRQVWVFGSAKERELGQAIARGRSGIYDLTGRTHLVDVVDLLGRAVAAVSNDSGLMHVAAAVGTPLVAIYGSSSPKMTPPLAADAKIVYRGLSCSPCFERECPLGHLNCLREISVEDVIQQLPP
jgi:heptosyltransferase-2